jgi:prepilin-type N-terminal cleavage/methylation domain-containing protein/prepilin-type processing-associated H-X9-DG protein
MRRHLAFTLVELLVVIAIIALLLAILMPSLTGVKAAAKRTHCANRLSGIGRAFMTYLSDYDNKLPTVEMNDQRYRAIHHYYLNYYINSADIKIWCHLGCLWGQGLIDHPLDFYCPATENWQEDFPPDSAYASIPRKALKGYVYWPMSKEDYTLAQWQVLYDHSDQAATENYMVGMPRTATFQAELLMTKAIASDYSFHAVKSYGGRGWAVNAVFPDGHVAYQQQPRDHGLGMWHEMRQFPGNICTISNWNSPAVWTDPVEAANNVRIKSPMVKFMFALEP